MLRPKLRGSIAFMATMLLATSMAVSGCGRNAVNPLAPPDDAAEGPGSPGDDPGEDPGDVPLPFPGGGGSTGGGAKPPAPAPAKPGTGAKPSGGLKPLPKPTATPGFKAPSGGGGNPAADMQEFVGLLRQFGYNPGESAVSNVRMQIAIVNRVPANRFHYVDGPSLGNTFQVRAREWPFPITYEQWKADGAALASRYQGVSYYVGRRALYRDILHDRYTGTGNDAELIVYKRLNRTQFFVSYRADGQIDDYGFFRIDDYRNFLPVPDAYWQ